MQECRTHQTGRRRQRDRLQTDMACLDKESCVSLLFVPSSLLFSRILFVYSLSTKLFLIDVHDDLNDEHEFVDNCCKNVRILSYNNSPIHSVFYRFFLNYFVWYHWGTHLALLIVCGVRLVKVLSISRRNFALGSF